MDCWERLSTHIYNSINLICPTLLSHKQTRIKHHYMWIWKLFDATPHCRQPPKKTRPKSILSLSNSQLPSLKLTCHLKMDGWNTSFLLGWPIFKGYVSFREGTIETHFHFHRNSHHPSHPHALSTTTAATAKVRKRTSSRLGSRKSLQLLLVLI